MAIYELGLYQRGSDYLVAKDVGEAVRLVWEGFTWVGIGPPPPVIGGDDYNLVVSGLGTDFSPVRVALEESLVEQVNDPVSDLRSALRDQFVPVSETTTTGRLSAASLAAAFAPKSLETVVNVGRLSEQGIANEIAFTMPTAEEVAAVMPTATDAVAGIVELATEAEVQGGTDATRVLTPATATATFAPIAIGADLDAVEATINTGRLSQNSLDGAYAPIAVETDLDTVETTLATGRLSVTSLNATYSPLGRGVSTVTTTERDALTGSDLWDGRVVLNITTDRLNRYDLGTTTWVEVADMQDIGTLLATSGLPAAPGTASRGVSNFAARADHVHPQPALETIDTTTTPAITLGSLVSNAGDGTRAWRKNGVVTLEVYIQAGGSLSDALTVPTGWRPPGVVRSDMNLGTVSVNRAVNLSAAGLLAVEGGMTNGQTLFGSITYITT